MPYQQTNACCLGLRGDTSGAPKVNQPFNTSDELLAFIGSDENAHFYGDATNPVSLQLDFIIDPNDYPHIPQFYNSFLAKLKTLQQTRALLTPGYNGDVNYATNIDESSMDSQCASGWPDRPNYYVW